MYFPNDDLNKKDPRPEWEQEQPPVQDDVTEQAQPEQPTEPVTPPQPEQNSYSYHYRPYPSGQTFTPEPKPKKKRIGMKIAAVCLCCVLLGGAAGVGGAALYTALNAEKASAENGTVIYESERKPTVVSVVNLPGNRELSPAEVYASNVNACVGITVSTTTNIFGYTTTSAATGSGFVISADGYIVTNYHVVDAAAKSTKVPISVSFQNGDTYDAKFIGGEEANDVAVLKIEATGLTPVLLGDSDGLVVGEAVFAIGNPLGELTYSLTDGIVSALDRVITTGSTDDSVSMNMLQTNCAINSGNSGGPLFNRYGEVIGITSAKMSGASSSSATIEGLGFAIPINDVKDIIQDLIRYGYVTGKPYMGVTVSTVSETDAKRYNLSVGAYIESIEAGSCAEKAGLQVGDIITAIDDTEVATHPALVAAKSMYRAGDTVTLKVVRDHQELEVKLTFDEAKPQSQATQGGSQSNQQQGQGGQGNQQGQNGQGGQDSQNGSSGSSGLYPWYGFPFGGIFG